MGKGRFDCLSLFEPLMTVVIFVCQFAPAGFSLNVYGQLTVQGLVLVFEKTVACFLVFFSCVSAANEISREKPLSAVRAGSR